jgi:hypothetical protein
MVQIEQKLRPKPISEKTKLLHMRFNKRQPPQEQSPLLLPARKPARHLSLEVAMAAVMKPRGGAAKMKPLMTPVDEFPSLKVSKMKDMEVRLLKLQVNIVNREEMLNKSDDRLRNSELGINEREALIEARKQVIESSQSRNVNTPSPFSTDERKAFEALRMELENQAESLKEAHRILLERENYIEVCGNELVDKSILLAECEARIEQREEDFERKMSRTPFRLVKEA